MLWAKLFLKIRTSLRDALKLASLSVPSNGLQKRPFLGPLGMVSKIRFGSYFSCLAICHLCNSLSLDVDLIVSVPEFTYLRHQTKCNNSIII